MKKILFVVTYLDTGGISRSLQNLLAKIDATKYAVDIFSMSHQGNFKSNFVNCNLLPKDALMHSLISRFGKARLYEKILSGCVKIVNKMLGGKLSAYVYSRVASKLSCSGYDAVIAFSEGVPTKLVSMMTHPNKVAWIHCDYKSYHKLNGNIDESNIYYSFKAIVNVSEFTQKSFIDLYPQYADKCYAIYNVLDVEMMKRQAEETYQPSYNDTYFNLVSVGRLDPIKRMSIIPSIAKQLIERGCSIRWYVVGPKGGTDEEYNNLIDNISSLGLSNEVIIVGERKNPYPFIKNANLLVNTSISEACPYVINEAKILCTPIVCPDFGSAKEFITNGKEGYYIPIDEFADCISKLINDISLRNEIYANLQCFNYDNDSIIKQFYKVVG